MARYEPRITHRSAGSVFAMVVRIDEDGEEAVDIGFKPRHFTTEKRAMQSIRRYLLVNTDDPAQSTFVFEDGSVKTPADLTLP